MFSNNKTKMALFTPLVHPCSLWCSYLEKWNFQTKTKTYAFCSHVHTGIGIRTSIYREIYHVQYNRIKLI